MHDVTNRSRVDLDAVTRDARALLALFAEVLREIGAGGAVSALPLVGDPSAGPISDEAVRAATIGFHLLSLAEQRAATRYRVEGELRGEVESGLWRSTLAAFAEADEARLRDAIRAVRVEPVLTAHPTEARRTSALEQYRELYALFPEDHPLDALRGDERDAIAAALERLFRGGEVRLRKPELSDERAVVIDLLTSAVPAALATVDARLEAAWRAAALPAGDPPLPELRFASWVGGDRDGHPLVTPEVTRASLLAYRQAALDLHRAALHRLRARLGLSALTQPTPPGLTDAIARLAGLLDESRSRVALARNPEEPWRTLLNLIDARLPVSAEAPLECGQYASGAELEADLEALRASLVAIGASRLARLDVAPVLRAARTFGLHLVALDVRQNSAVHDRAVAQLLAAAGEREVAFPDWDEARRRALLERELASARPFAQPGARLGAEGDAVVPALREVARWQRAHGGAGLGALIVSMTRSVSDLLVPFLLAREADLLRPGDGGPVCPLPVVPLFETIEDLEHAPAILDGFLAEPIVARSLEQLRREAGLARPLQQVMVGYSDSNKDGGIVASLWGLHRAQARLLEVAERRSVTLRFFHGRGGTLSRGAGPTHRFLSALPRGALAGGLRLTEQGETVFQKYGTADAATYNLELLAAGSARRLLLDREGGEPPGELARAMDLVATHARRAYGELVGLEGFLSFFREATPIDVIETSGIGSRPSRRTGQGTLADLRAIPWVFSWAQARFALTGWYGLGAGLGALAREDPALLAALLARALHWPPLRYLIGNVSVSLLSADLGVARAYAGLVADAELRGRVFAAIEAEHARTREALERAYGGPLAVRRGRIARLLALREDGLRAMNDRQRDLLVRWRRGGRGDDALRLELLRTVNAIAAGLRATG